jgi:hypothetical protein
MANKTANSADARVQAIRNGGRDDPRHRTGGENEKQQFNLKPLTGKATTAPEIWAAALAA